MNYLRLYNRLIASRKMLQREKGKGVYYEEHHIIPRCFGGRDTGNNLVLLTGKEHYLAHVLLIHIYTGKQREKMVSALWLLCSKSKGKISARNYEYIQAIHSKMIAERNKRGIGKKMNPESTAKTIASRNKNGQPWHTNETRKKIKEKRKEQKIDGLKIAASRIKNGTNRRSAKCKKKMSDNSPNKKEVSQFTDTGVFVRDYDSLMEAAKYIGVSICCISGCIAGRQKTSKGFTFKLKKVV